MFHFFAGFRSQVKIDSRCAFGSHDIDAGSFATVGDNTDSVKADRNPASCIMTFGIRRGGDNWSRFVFPLNADLRARDEPTISAANIAFKR
jgi:hypothetical protein